MMPAIIIATFQPPRVNNKITVGRAHSFDYWGPWERNILASLSKVFGRSFKRMPLNDSFKTFLKVLFTNLFKSRLKTFPRLSKGLLALFH